MEKVVSAGVNFAFYVPVDCVNFSRYCGKMYSPHFFPYGGLTLLVKGFKLTQIEGNSKQEFNTHTKTQPIMEDIYEFSMRTTLGLIRSLQNVFSRVFTWTIQCIFI